MPMILAPAGSKASFLAAAEAGADAVYCGLKTLSARMEAKNFTITELAPLTAFAHDRGMKVYIALNSILKPDELDKAKTIIAELEQKVKPDALILQDLAIIQLARQAGFSGELHLSTLANVSFAKAFKLVKQKLGVTKVVIPRELNIDEIRRTTTKSMNGSLSWSFSNPKGVRILFFKRTNMKNEFTTDVNFNMEMTKTTSQGRKEVDKESYSVTPGASYKFNKSITAGLTSEYERTYNKKGDTKSSMFRLSIWIEILF